MMKSQGDGLVRVILGAIDSVCSGTLYKVSSMFAVIAK